MRVHAKHTIGRLAAAALLGTLALVAGPGQQALAGPAHSASHAKKKRKPSQVLVHCASVTVNCKPDARNRGPAGPAGAVGPTGPTGPAGHGIIDRIRSTGAVTSNDVAPVEVGLSSSTFNQAAGQDERLMGLAKVVLPAGECETTKKEPHRGDLEGVVALNGTPNGIITVGESEYVPDSTATVPIVWTPGLSDEFDTTIGALPIVGAPQTNTLTIHIKDNCNAVGTTDFTVESVAIDVLSAS